MNLDGSNLRRLTDSRFADFCPAVSPDGRRIAFYSSRLGGELALYIMLADGSDVRFVAGPVAPNHCPRWSATGNRVLFFRPQRDPSTAVSLVAVSADGSHLTPASPDAQIASADLSPDGLRIVFSRYSDSDRALTGVFVRPAAPLVKETAIDYDNSYGQPVSWSPDGAWVAYICSMLPPYQLNGNLALCLAAPDGSNSRKIDLGINYVDYRSLEWSPDSRFVIATGFNGRSIDVESGTTNEVPLGWSQVQWLGDARRLVYVDQPQFNNDVFISAFDGTGAANLTNSPADDQHPSPGPLR